MSKLRQILSRKQTVINLFMYVRVHVNRGHTINHKCLYAHANASFARGYAAGGGCATKTICRKGDPANRPV